MADQIIINLDFEGQHCLDESSVQVVSSDTSWEDFEMMLKIYADMENIAVSYYDDENDAILINSQDELSEAFKVARAARNNLRLSVKSLKKSTENKGNSDKETDNIVTDIKKQSVSIKMDKPDIVVKEEVPESNVESHDKDIKVKTVNETEKEQEIPMQENECSATRPKCVNPPPSVQQIKIAEADHVIPLPPPPVPRRKPSPALSAQTSPPPEWFIQYMAKFKKELVEASSNKVAERTVAKVLRGLEGAVITSVKEVTDHVTSSTEPSVAFSSQKDTYCHDRIICDKCEKSIIGVRYKCGNCDDYDLCERCEAEGNTGHDQSHVFLKIRRPLNMAGRRKDGKLCPLLPKNLYKHEAEMRQHLAELARQKERGHAEHNTTHAHARHANKEPIDKLKRKQEKLKQKSDKLKVKQEKLKRRIQEEKELPHKKEKIQSLASNPVDTMDAVFVRHDSIPDDTHVQPGTKFSKSWVLRNTGLSPWSAGTILSMIYGNMEPSEPEVGVPNIAPGEEGTVAVNLVAPMEPGVFQSHWRLSYCGVRFGPRIWCSIIVDPKEVLGDSEELTDLDFKVADLKVTDDMELQAEAQDHVEEEKAEILVKSDSSHEPEEHEDARDPLVQVIQSEESAHVSEASHVSEPAEQHVQAESETANQTKDEKTEEELASFEMLSMNGGKAQSSSTATPNNTPLESRDVTPPVTPPRSASPTSSVEIVHEDQSETDDVTVQLVQQRMRSLELSNYRDAEYDIESLSSDDMTSSCDESDGDFYIVPIPDFFNPELPASREASRHLIVNKEQADSGSSTDPQETEPLLGHDNSSPYTPLTNEDEPEEEAEEHEEFKLANDNAEQEEFKLANDMSVDRDGNQSDDDNEQESHVTTDDVTADASADVTEENVTEVKEMNAPAQNDEEDGAEETVSTIDPIDEQAIGSPPFAAHMVTQALDYASKTTSRVYHTAKDVFHTLQARTDYTPPQSEWAPETITWTPARSDWTPTPAPEATGEPWNPPTDRQPTERNDNPMSILIEMGFADRSQNQGLLEKHKQDVEKVIQELLVQTDNDWHANRH